MRFETSFLKTRVARRIFALFVACAVLPVVALSLVSLTFVSTQIERQSASELRQVAKSTALTVFERLTERESELLQLAESGSLERLATNKDSALRTRLAERYRELTLLGRGGSTKPILTGEDTRASTLPLFRLRDQSSITLDDDGNAYLGVPVPGDALLVALLDLEHLLEPDQGEGYSGLDSFLVFDEGGRLLYASHPASQPFISAALDGGFQSHSGTFTWEGGDEAHLAAAWMLFLRGRYGAPSWRFIVSSPRVEIFALASEFKLTFLLVTVLCMSVAFLASLTQIRRTMQPLEVLRQATERVGRGDFSTRIEAPLEDEFSLLAKSFDDMSTRVNEQFEEIRAARDAAEKASRAKTEFLALVSHEVRTPMNGILAMSELASTTEDAAERRECLSLVRSSTESLLHVLRDILDFSSMEGGEAKIAAQPFAVVTTLASAARLYEALARKKGLSLDVYTDVPEGLALVGDGGRLRQLVTNLVENAIKFTASGQVRVQIGADPVGEDEYLLSLSVEDTGIGIEQDKLRFIFEPFTQAESFLQRSYGGTGLGLASAKRLVERMGGRIWAESSVGVGSAFHAELTLPAAKRETERIEAPTRSTRPAFGPGTRVLVAEDNLVNQRVAEKMLTREGLTVALAANGREALEACANERFDLVLMDLQMPVMDGLEATREILSAEGDSGHAPTIIALTAHGSERDIEECRAAGMVDVLTKPIAREDLVDALRQHLGRGESDPRAAGEAKPGAESTQHA